MNEGGNDKPKAKLDPTFVPEAAMGSPAWVARRFGMSKDQFRRKLPELQSEGFPDRDPILCLWLKADVDAWLARRRRVPDADRFEIAAPPRRGVNLDGL